MGAREKLGKLPKLRDITLTALLLHLPLATGCLRLSWYADWFGMERIVRLLFAIWAVTFLVLAVGYWLEKEERPAARRVCAAGLVLFAVSAASVGWGCWFRGHGAWQPWAGISEANVTRVALGVAYSSMLQANEAEIIPDWDASVSLSPEEQRQAIAMLRDIRVKNPVVNEVLWDTPKGLPEREGEPTEKLTLYYRKGNIGRVYSVVVEYPYINSREAVDHGQARELERFINGLCEKYAAELAEYEASWDIYNERFNEELDKWRQERELYK